MNDHVLNQLIGKRFRIIGDHPHSGCHGEIVRIGDTIFGKRPVIKLDQPHLGIPECYIMNSKHVAKEIPTKKRGKYES